MPLSCRCRLPEGVWDIEAFNYGTMKLEYFAPRGRDRQTPHDQDELYIVIKGSSELISGESRYTFEAGDILFVEAGKDHRFENYSDDFATWVVFWGPEGGA